LSFSSLRRPFVPALTGLRFFAAAAIFVLHARDHNLIPADFFLYTFDLSQAVTLFFVLSGFVISYASCGRYISIIDFYKSRIFRVFPGLLLSILLVVLILPSSLYLPTDKSPYSSTLVFIISSLGLQSWFPIPSFYFAFNAVTWSISVELFFYFCFPLLNKLSTRKLFRIFLMYVLVAALFTYIISVSSLPSFGINSLDIPVKQGFLYINPLMRLPEFMIGILGFRFFSSNFYFRWLGLLNPDNLRSNSFISGIFASVSIVLFIYLGFQTFGQNLNVQFLMFLSRLLSAIYFFLIISLMATCQGPVVQFLGWPQFLFLGEVSYGIYLYHQPLMIRAAQVGGSKFAGIQILPQNLFLISVFTVGVASISFYFLELPITRLFKKR